MIIRKYKNNNITVKLERLELLDGLPDFVEALANSCELDFIELLNDGAPVAYGNDYAVYAVNIAWREYHVGPRELERLQAGYTARLQPVDVVPQILVPESWHCEPFELDGVRGTIYTLQPRLLSHEVDELEAVPGVRVLKRAPEYAPELWKHALFIPDGITREARGY